MQDEESGTPQQGGWQPPEYVSPWLPASSSGDDDANGGGDTISFGRGPVYNAGEGPASGASQTPSPGHPATPGYPAGPGYGAPAYGPPAPGYGAGAGYGAGPTGPGYGGGAGYGGGPGGAQRTARPDDPWPVTPSLTAIGSPAPFRPGPGRRPAAVPSKSPRVQLFRRGLWMELKGGCAPSPRMDLQLGPLEDGVP